MRRNRFKYPTFKSKSLIRNIRNAVNREKIRYEILKEMNETELGRRVYFFNKANLLISGITLLIASYLFFIKNSSIFSKWSESICFIIFGSISILLCFVVGHHIHSIVNGKSVWNYLPEPSMVKRDFEEMSKYLEISKNNENEEEEYYGILNSYYSKMNFNNVSYNDKLNESFKRGAFFLILSIFRF